MKLAEIKNIQVMDVQQSQSVKGGARDTGRTGTTGAATIMFVFKK